MQLALHPLIGKNGLVGLKTIHILVCNWREESMSRLFVCQNVFFPSLDTRIKWEVTIELIKNPSFQLNFVHHISLAFIYCYQFIFCFFLRYIISIVCLFVCLFFFFCLLAVWLCSLLPLRHFRALRFPSAKYLVETETKIWQSKPQFLLDFC